MHEIQENLEVSDAGSKEANGSIKKNSDTVAKLKARLKNLHNDAVLSYQDTNDSSLRQSKQNGMEEVDYQMRAQSFREERNEDVKTEGGDSSQADQFIMELSTDQGHAQYNHNSMLVGLGTDLSGQERQDQVH